MEQEQVQRETIEDYCLYPRASFFHSQFDSRQVGSFFNTTLGQQINDTFGNAIPGILIRYGVTFHSGLGHETSCYIPLARIADATSLDESLYLDMVLSGLAIEEQQGGSTIEMVHYADFIEFVNTAQTPNLRLVYDADQQHGSHRIRARPMDKYNIEFVGEYTAPTLADELEQVFHIKTSKFLATLFSDLDKDRITLDDLFPELDKSAKYRKKTGITNFKKAYLALTGQVEDCAPEDYMNAHKFRKHMDGIIAELDAPLIQTSDIARNEKRYFREINAVPLFSREQEFEAFKELERLDIAGVIGASYQRHKIIDANLRWVASHALRDFRKSKHHPLSLLDLIQEGNKGLIRAVDKFKYWKGFRFTTYSAWWIKQAITRAKAEKSRTIRLPVHVHEKLGRIAKREKQLRFILGRDPKHEELADAMDLTPSKLSHYQRVAKHSLSLNAPKFDDDENSEIGDSIPDDDTFYHDLEQKELGERLRKLLHKLEFKQQMAVRFRFGLSDVKDEQGRFIQEEGMTLDQVGRRFKCSRENARQLINKALSRMRVPENIIAVADFYRD